MFANLDPGYKDIFYQNKCLHIILKFRRDIGSRGRIFEFLTINVTKNVIRSNKKYSKFWRKRPFLSSNNPFFILNIYIFS